MARPRAITKKEFMKVYQKAKTVTDMAVDLGICEMTVRNYLKKYGLVASGVVEKRQRSLDVYNAYRGKISVEDLATRFDMDLTTVRYHLRKAMIYVYSQPNPPKFPRPRILSHIKIVHLLQKFPKLAKLSKAETIADRTALSDESVKIYLSQLK